MQLSLLTGLAAQSAILSAAGLHADIRWPNDLLVSGRKCAGILVETSLSSGASREPASLRYAVIGIGINANHSGFPPELLSLATSLRLASGARVSLEQLASALLVALDRELSLLAPDGSSTRQLLARFAAASSWVSGRSVRVGGLDGYTGVTAGLNENGFLLVDGDDGVQHTVLSGGVRDRDEI
jgi:BirA family biotin operon repressor/biotin-[acetyl-CoA-carboxylase] ligase